MFSVGKAMSSAPIISGIKKLPNAPARIGMITRKIITVACIVKSIVYASGAIWPPSAVYIRLPRIGIARPRPRQLPAHAERQQPPMKNQNSVLNRNCIPMIL